MKKHFFEPQLFNDHFQNYKRYSIPKAQLIIADIPYNIGINAYASNPSWYNEGDNKKGESKKANQSFFDTDKNFNVNEFMHFVSTMLKKESKEVNSSPCMIVFCEFEQQFMLIEVAKKHGLNKYINLVFNKNYSAQVLKANMKIVGNTEYALIFYRDKLPKFRNNGKMIFNCMNWEKDTGTIKIHPTQKPIKVIQKLISIFTDEGDVIIDPTAGSGVSLLAGALMGRRCFGFEIKKEFCEKAGKTILANIQIPLNYSQSSINVFA